MFSMVNCSDSMHLPLFRCDEMLYYDFIHLWITYYHVLEMYLSKQRDHGAALLAGWSAELTAKSADNFYEPPFKNTNYML